MIYLDNAATTLPKPDCVAQAVSQAMGALGNPGRGVHGASLDAARIVYDTRQRLAALFHAQDARQVVFTANATQSLNTAIKGTLRPGDHAITTVLEHNSVLRPLYELQRAGMAMTIAGCDSLGRVRYDEIEAAIRSDTRAIVITHASNLTGNVVNLFHIGEIAHRHGLLLIVDASQSAGFLDIDMQAMRIGILCFTGHKALLGPQGTGGMIVSNGVSVRPLLTGGSGMQSYSETHPAQMPEALEAGTLNTHGIAGLNAALRLLEETSLASVRERELSLMRAFYDGARAIPGVTVYGDFSAIERCPIVSLNVRDYDSAEVSDALYTHYGIATRPGAHCAPLMHKALGTQQQGAVRFSFSQFNTMEDIQAAVAALRELAQEG